MSLPVQLPDNQSFENFTAGDNELLLRHLHELAVVKGFSSTFVSGAQDSGKTHLLSALCGQFESAMFIDCNALDGLHSLMLEGLECSELICFDNIDALKGSIEWQAAVFDLFNRSKENDACHLVFSSDTAAAQLNFELPDLKSRLQWGMSFHLKPLSDSQRHEFLVTRALQRGLDMPPEVARFLLTRGKRDMTSLVSILDKLDSLSLQQQRRLTIPFVKQILG